MLRRVAPVCLLAVLGCSRGAPSGAGTSSAEAGAKEQSPAGASLAATEIFSAPIAGARVGSGEAIAVGLVLATRSITAARVDAAGHAVWTTPLVHEVSWSQDAELHAWPISAGAIVVWRGLVAGKSSRVGVVVAPDGRVVEGPFEVGPLLCATDDGLAWSEAGAKGNLVRLRSWAQPPLNVTSALVGDDVTLTCGARRAYAITEGDEGTATRLSTVGDATPVVSVPPFALGRDEERDLFAWAEGDEVGLVRIAQSGAVTTGDVRGGALAPVHGAGARVAPEDDVVAVDADARAAFLVTTHDETEACPQGRGGSSVRALRIPRDGSKSASTVLATSACERDFGPFWTSMLGHSLVAAWVERGLRTDKASAPITGLAFRTLDEGASLGHIAQAADVIADAGCDATRCYAVALVRPPAGDGMKPEAVRVLAYP